MSEKHLVLTEMGGGLPAKIRMDSFVAFTRSDLCKAGTAKYVVMFDGAGKPEEQLAIWIKEAEHHKLDYIPIRDPEDHTILHGITLFAKKLPPNHEPILRIKTSSAKRPVRHTALAKKSKTEQFAELKETLRSKYPTKRKSKWALGAKVGALAATFLIMGFLGASLAAIYFYPDQYEACWQSGKSVYLPYLQMCMGWEING